MFTTCCWCYSLKMGCLIIAISSAVIYGLSTLFMALFLSDVLPGELLPIKNHFNYRSLVLIMFITQWSFWMNTLLVTCNYEYSLDQ